IPLTGFSLADLVALDGSPSFDHTLRVLRDEGLEEISEVPLDSLEQTAPGVASALPHAGLEPAGARGGFCPRRGTRRKATDRERSAGRLRRARTQGSRSAGRTGRGSRIRAVAAYDLHRVTDDWLRRCEAGCVDEAGGRQHPVRS